MCDNPAAPRGPGPRPPLPSLCSVTHKGLDPCYPMVLEEQEGDRVAGQEPREPDGRGQWRVRQKREGREGHGDPQTGSTMWPGCKCPQSSVPEADVP